MRDNKKPSILIIEDDVAFAKSLIKALEIEGFIVEWTPRASEVIAILESKSCDLVITDFRLSDGDGISLVKKIKEFQKSIPVIFMTAFGTAETAINAINLGAYDYLTKPLDIEELLSMIRKAIDNKAERILNIDDGLELSSLIGNSRSMQGVYKEIGTYSKNDITLLIRGETGTGKELVAKSVHEHSARKHEPYVVVNCAAMPESLIESELFGYNKGAFTGANSGKIGYFEAADNGTLFLDEIGELSLSLQVKLLRILQDQVIQPLGGVRSVKLNVRIITATNKDLEAAIKAKTFREDLYYRLNAAQIIIPPLKDRVEDIPDLVRHFLAQHGFEMGIEFAGIKPDALNSLCEMHWPGNVRQLENFVSKLLVHAREQVITREQIESLNIEKRHLLSSTNDSISLTVSKLLKEVSKSDSGHAHKEAVRIMETELISQALRLSGDNLTKVSKWLGISRLTLRNKMKEL